MSYPEGFDSTDPLMRLYYKLDLAMMYPLDFVGIYTLETLIDSVRGVRL